MVHSSEGREGCRGSYCSPSSPGENLVKIQDFSLKHVQLNQEAVLLSLSKKRKTHIRNKQKPLQSILSRLCWNGECEPLRQWLAPFEEETRELGQRKALLFSQALMSTNKKAPPDQAPQTVVCLHPDASEPCRTQKKPQWSRNQTLQEQN